MPRERRYANDAERQRACRQRRRDRETLERAIRETETERRTAEQRLTDLRTLFRLIEDAERADTIDPETARRLVGWIHRIADQNGHA